MTKHRPGQPPTPPEPTPPAAPPPGGAREALDRLAQRAGLAADPTQVVEQATAAALVQTRTWLMRAIWIAVALFVLGIATVIVLGLYTIKINGDLSELSSTGAVGANRTKASLEILGVPGQGCDPLRPESVTFECLNRDRAAIGLPPFVPIEGLAPSQLGAVLGDERAELRRVREQREESRSGVTTPPTSGRFRDPGR